MVKLGNTGALPHPRTDRYVGKPIRQYYEQLARPSLPRALLAGSFGKSNVTFCFWPTAAIARTKGSKER